MNIDSRKSKWGGVAMPPMIALGCCAGCGEENVVFDVDDRRCPRCNAEVDDDRRHGQCTLAYYDGRGQPVAFMPEPYAPLHRPPSVWCVRGVGPGDGGPNLAACGVALVASGLRDAATTRPCRGIEITYTCIWSHVLSESRPGRGAVSRRLFSVKVGRDEYAAHQNLIASYSIQGLVTIAEKARDEESVALDLDDRFGASLAPTASEILNWGLDANSSLALGAQT